MMGRAAVFERVGSSGFFVPVLFLRASRCFRSASVYPLEDAGECLGIEPDAVILARVDNYTAYAPVIEPVH
jgi:hypothetical protein